MYGLVFLNIVSRVYSQLIFTLVRVFLGNIKPLRVVVTDISERSAILACETMTFSDERVLLGYVLHFIATPFRNISYYDGRDGCGADG